MHDMHDAVAEGSQSALARFRLVVGPVGGVSKRIPLRQGRVSIGRDVDNAVALDDGSLSRHHAVL